MSSLFVNNIKHTNTQDAISIDTSGNVILDKVGTGAFYRTGTFTPFYSSHAATVANESDVFTPASYLRQSGSYVRIGDLVNVNIRLSIDHSAAGYQNGGAGSGLTAVQGLPFKVKNVTDYLPSTSTIYFGVDVAMGWTGYSLTGLGVTNTKSIYLYYSSAGGSVSRTQLQTWYYTTGSHNSTDSDVIFSLTYETDEA